MHRVPHPVAPRSAGRLLTLCLLILATTVLCAGPSFAKSSVNRGLSVEDGETLREGLSNVNGGIDVGDDAIVEGDVESVNGGIDIGDRADVRSIESVNGGIDLGSEVRVRGGVETVNGGLDVGSGSRIDGGIETVNGGVRLDGTEVGGGIETVNGRIHLKGGSRVGGDIEVGKAGGWGWGKKKPLRIEIADGSTVAGDLIAEKQDRRVEVCLRDGGKIEGKIVGAVETCD